MMKVNFKRMITVLAATAMCAVPMTSAMSASAAGRSYSLAKADEQAEEAYIAELLKYVSSEDAALVKGTATVTLRDPIKERQEKEAKRRFEIWKLIHGGDPIKPGLEMADNTAVSIGEIAYINPDDPDAWDRDWGPFGPYVRESDRLAVVESGIRTR
ncbi:hypothetical protein [Ruminococcus flavefaciens]|uniref:hypothetical protein n=2 Tax=Ruminococcus flavefaciens TaxID=1265 RepID=UPI0026EB41AA|nr:hypothetical protein [Ruminococcus flavefaciens]